MQDDMNYTKMVHLRLSKVSILMILSDLHFEDNNSKKLKITVIPMCLNVSFGETGVFGRGNTCRSRIPPYNNYPNSYVS